MKCNGEVDFTSGIWKSVFSQVIAASHLRDKQEAMLLMQPGDWLQTNTGFWQLSATRAVLLNELCWRGLKESFD